MSKRIALVIAVIVGMSAGLLVVSMGDWMTAPRDTKPIKSVETAQEVTLSQEAWEQLEEILNR